MATIPLPQDFSEFLKLLSVHKVRYLLIGGYAVNYHGYVRATADMDIWVEPSEQNAERMVTVLKEFGFDLKEPHPGLFINPDRVVRMGEPPIRIEIMSSISGVDFDECYKDRVEASWDDLTIQVISLEKLKKNKHASGRRKDFVDLEHLE